MKIYHFSFIVALIYCCGIIVLSSCHSNPEKPNTEAQTAPISSSEDCIQRILAKDDAFGSIRNHACESISLAETVRNYAESLGQMDYSDCPSEFSKAFQSHRSAWIDMIPLMEKYPDLRGEMHDLFDQIKVSQDSVQFNALLKNIWDTWEIVEKEK